MCLLSCFLSDLESRYSANILSSEKDIYEVYSFQWEMWKELKAIAFKTPFLGNDWECKSKIEGKRNHKRDILGK